MRRRFVLQIAVLALVLTACTAAPVGLTDEERQAIASEIHQVTLDDIAAAEQNNFEALMAGYVNDPSAYFVGDPAMYLNRLTVLSDINAIREYWEPAMTTRSATNVSIVNEYIAVLSADHAVQVYEANWSVADTLGNITSEGPMTATTVWIRQNGDWKVLHYHQSWSEN